MRVQPDLPVPDLLSRRLLLGLLLLLTCSYSLLARDTYGADFRAYYVASSAAHARLDPYLNQVNVDERYADRDWLQVNSRFIYPPSSLMLFSPFARLPYRAAKVAWGTGMALVMAGVLWSLSRRMPRAAWVAVVLFLSLPMMSNVDNGQVDGLILALTLAMFYARRSWLGGACLGAAIAIKLAPALVLLWLLATKRWAAAAWSVGVAAVLTLVAARVWGFALVREFVEHLRMHLGPHPAMLQHTFTSVQVLYGRFVVMGTNTYSLHYIYGTRQNPLMYLGSAAGGFGLALVLTYLGWMRLSRTGRALTEEASLFGFLVVALFVNALLWPAGLVACFPLTMLLVARSRTPARDGLLMLLPFFLPVESVASLRFCGWLLAAGFCLWGHRSGAPHLAFETWDESSKEPEISSIH